MQARRTNTKEIWNDNVVATGRIRVLFVNNRVNASMAVHIIVPSLREGMTDSPPELVLVFAEASVTMRNDDD